MAAGGGKDNTADAPSPVVAAFLEEAEKATIELGKELDRMRKSAARSQTTPQFCFFDANGDKAEGELELVIMEAILNDCDDQKEEIMLATVWGELVFLESQIEKQALDDRECIAHALEVALVRREAHVIKTLLDFGARCEYVILDNLFVAANNKYKVGEKTSHTPWPDSAPVDGAEAPAKAEASTSATRAAGSLWKSVADSVVSAPRWSQGPGSGLLGTSGGGNVATNTVPRGKSLPADHPLATRGR